VKVVAGVATGGVPLSSIISDKFDRPYYFIRSKEKGHGKTNVVEGDVTLLNEKTSALVFEDLISTGGSSFKAAEAMQTYAPVHSMIAIFTYGFPASEKCFAEADYDVTVLSDYPTLISVAKEMNYLNMEEEELLMTWSEDPTLWSENYLNSIA
jgi:orotate phosphoribosyltransferase